MFSRKKNNKELSEKYRRSILGEITWTHIYWRRVQMMTQFINSTFQRASAERETLIGRHFAISPQAFCNYIFSSVFVYNYEEKITNIHPESGERNRVGCCCCSAHRRSSRLILSADKEELARSPMRNPNWFLQARAGCARSALAMTKKSHKQNRI